MEISTIGKVVSARRKHQWDGWRDVRSEIHILPAYAAGLEGLDAHSHLIVLHAMDNKGKVNLNVTPQGKPTSPKVGLFATRCMWRPNPIGVTTVKLLSVNGHVLDVLGLDAIDGTDVLDIKPYWPQYDAVETARYPVWVDQLEF